jgi:hypothetical protein
MGCISLPPLFQNDLDPLGLAAGMLIICLIPLSLFVGVGAAASDRARGTLAFLQALPVPTWRVALMKLAFGLVAVTIPIALTIGLFLFCNWQFEISRPLIRQTSALIDIDDWYLNTFVHCILIAASLFIWSAAAGVNRKDEVSAGTVALAVMVGWTTLLVLLVEKTSLFRDSLKLQVVALSTAPVGPAVDNMFLKSGWESSYLTMAFSVTIAVHLVWVGWYVLRFARPDKREVRSPRTAERVAGDWLAPPRRNWLSAVIWKPHTGVVAEARPPVDDGDAPDHQPGREQGTHR